MNATIEEQGMLKILEHLAEMLKSKKQMTFKAIEGKTGIEYRHWTKLMDNGIIQRTGQTNHPYYQWIGLKPNIYMAKRVFEDGMPCNVDNEEIGGTDKKYEFYRIEYNEKQAAFHFDDIVNRYNTPGWRVIAHNVTYQNCTNFFNECVIKYPVFDLLSIGRERLYHPSYDEILSEFNVFMLGRLNESLHANEPIINQQKKEKIINIPFIEFWDLYDKKVGDKGKLEKKWISLSNKDRAAAIEYIPKYKEARPDKQFRKDPNTFLNNRSWEDEIVQQTYTKIIPSQPPQNDYPLNHFTDRQLWDELKRRGYIGTISKALE